MTLFFPPVRPQLSGRLPQVVNEREEVALELDHFTEYVTEPRPEHRKKLEDLAVRIIRSNNIGNDPIFQVRVEGHADVARRIPAGAARKSFEDDISAERAEKGLEFLIAAIARKGGEPLSKRILRGSKTFGLGTRQLKHPNAFTKDQFEENQRIVIIIRLVTFIPPLPQAKPPPSSVVEERFAARLMRSTTVSIGIPGTHVIESVSLTATIEITDKIDKKMATFNVTATGGGFGGGPTPAGGSANKTPGALVDFSIFRLMGKNRAFIDLKSFVGGVTVFVDFGGGAGSVNRGGTLSFSFDALESAGVNTQPQVIRLPSGDGGVSVPSITGLTVMPLGRMTMLGAPTAL